MRLTPRETAATSAHVLCTPYNVAPVYSVTIRNHIRRMLVCLDVTCQLHFRQNDRDPLRVTAVAFTYYTFIFTFSATYYCFRLTFLCNLYIFCYCRFSKVLWARLKHGAERPVNYLLLFDKHSSKSKFVEPVCCSYLPSRSPPPPSALGYYWYYYYSCVCAASYRRHLSLFAETGTENSAMRLSICRAGSSVTSIIAGISSVGESREAKSWKHTAHTQLTQVANCRCLGNEVHIGLYCLGHSRTMLPCVCVCV